MDFTLDMEFLIANPEIENNIQTLQYAYPRLISLPRPYNTPEQTIDTECCFVFRHLSKIFHMLYA